MRIQAPRGTSDVLPGQAERWRMLEEAFFKTSFLYGYREVRTPTFEETGLFARTAGETSDIVTKQMYTFEDKGGRSITLKPEGTAPAVRMAIEHSLFASGQTLRLCYETAIYRYERPQKGRLREAHQFGMELFGTTSPFADAEIIEASVHFYRAIGIDRPRVLVNSLGDGAARGRYRDALMAHAGPFLKSQSPEVQEKAERNPLRLLDSKDPDTIEVMKSAPSILNYLSDESKSRFEVVQEELHRASIDFEVRPEIVRGLDYYSETVFEIQSDMLGAQGALCGGGRYDGLVKELGGGDVPAVGVGIGIERALIVLEQTAENESAAPDAFAAAMGPDCIEVARQTVRQLRQAGLSVQADLDGRSPKSQFRLADKSGAKHVIVFGGDELARGAAGVKRLADGTQTEVPLDQLADWLRGQSREA